MTTNILISVPLSRLEDNIKMYLRQLEWGGGGLDWIDLAQNRDRW